MAAITAPAKILLVPKPKTIKNKGTKNKKVMKKYS